MRCDWDGIKRLGAYLGLAIDDAPGTPGSIQVICWSLRAFKKKYSPEICARIPGLILETDFSRLPRDGDPDGALARDVFSRLFPKGEDRELLEFSITFRRFAGWFRAAADVTLSVMGVKKEDISLDRPEVKNAVSELKELPCRRLGEMNFYYRTHGYAAISRYVESLLSRYEDKALTRENCRMVIEIMNKVSGHPAYFKSMSAAQKLSEARPLLVAISELQLYSVKEPAKDDLLAALSLLLFNVFPAPKLLKFITRLEPSPGNEALQYDYNAILAMNFMLAGMLDRASAYNEKALKYAGDEEKRAYAHILDSCICLSRGATEEAMNALYRCSTLTKDKRMKATALFYLGIVQYESGNVKEAMESFQISRIGLEDELDVMNACNNIGTCELLLGDMKAAASEFENVDYVGRCMTSNSALQLKSVACGNLGLIYLHTANYDRAIERFKEALKLGRDLHNKKGVADQLGNIGLALKAKKDYHAALEYFRSSVNVSFLEDYLDGARFSLAQIDQLMALEGRYDEAEAFRQEMIRRNPGIAKMLRR